MAARVRTADAVVIGGGIMGTSIALFLAEAGLGRILLIEKRALAAGSSGKSGAILRQHYSHDVTIKMAREGLVFYASFAERYGTDIGFRRPGMVFVADERDRAALAANVALQRRLGVVTEAIGPDELGELAPGGRYEGVVAAWESEAGFVDPVRTVGAVAAAAENRGVELLIGEAVRGIAVADGRTTGVVMTSGATIAAPVVVSAGGPWSSALLEPLGIALPLRVVRPEQAFFERTRPFTDELPIFGDLPAGIYWKPEARTWLRVGRMSYEEDQTVVDPDRYDEGISAAFIEDTRRRAAIRVPGFAAAVSWGGCGALYTVTPDAHPFIGPAPDVAGLWVVAGFSGHGFKMGPAVGRGVAALITGSGGGALEPSFFALDRLARGQPITTTYTYGILG